MTLPALTPYICRWVRTGDEVEYDTEGNIYVVDRLKVTWHLSRKNSRR